MLKKKINITFLVMFLAGIFGAAYAKAAEITIPDGYSLHVNDGTLHLPEEGINNAGTLQVTTGAITLGGNWTNTGTFIPGTGNVELIGTTGQTISGANTFYNLICSSAGNQLFFEAGKSQTVTANWTAIGNAGSYLVLRSTVNGTQWYVDPAGTRNVSYVDVKDSVNSSIPPIDPAVWTDQGNNVNWITTQTNTATLVAQWEFDGNFTAINDSSYDGIASPGVAFVCGKIGKAVSFDGGEAVGSYNTTIDYVDSQKTTPASDFNGGFSVMGWIKPEDQVSGYFLDHDESCCTTSAYGFGAYVVSPGKISLMLRGNSSPGTMFGESAYGVVPAGLWSHVALTWDGSTSGGIKIFINGQETPTTIRHHSGAFIGLSGSAPLSLRIGATHANSLNTIRGYVGSIDHISVWKGVLSADAILADFNNTRNSAPVANAGSDQQVNELELVTLDGSGSNDQCNDPLTYNWIQIAGTSVTLNLDNPVHPTFIAPNVPRGGETLSFQLTVSDGNLPPESDSDTVDITVKDINHCPVADAGPDQRVQEGSPVTLDGSNSYDPDVDPLTCTWRQIGGPPSIIDSADPCRPTFVAPFVGQGGVNLTFELTMSDGLCTATDTMNVVVENINHCPTADAGDGQTKDEGSLVALNGAESSDPDSDTITCTWTQISGISVILSDPHTPNPTFDAPSVHSGREELKFSLVVYDGLCFSDPDEVIITVLDTNEPPACDLAQASQSLMWPPNHKLVEVGITGVTDLNNNQVTITITGVTQDEPVSGSDDGDTSPDAVIQGDKVLLRAERAGRGNGRVYQITFTADDGDGGQCTGTIEICVPRNRQTDTCIDDGQNYNSLQE